MNSLSERLRTKAAWLASTGQQDLAALLRESADDRDALTRRIETAPPWIPDDPRDLTDKHLAALKLRWSTGPEQYQADADALIGAVLVLQAERDRLREVLDAIGGLLSANGCDCDCEHLADEHDDDCERCLACRIGEAHGAARGAP